MDGILLVDKPAGPTSHDIVLDVRRLTGEKRVGHAGTLDPMATGLLIILIGRATKLSERFLNDSKSYSGTITFGRTTDTLDGQGKTLNERDAESLTRQAVEDAALQFTGEIEQIPPMVSAIKVNGRPLYKMARRGESFDIPPRSVTINSFSISGWRPGRLPEADFSIDCSKGTYIRSIARDLGDAVGYGATLTSLIRTRCGSYTLIDAASLTDLKKGGLVFIDSRLISPDAA